MKTASVRDLRNRYSSVLLWIEAGEEVLITQRGKPIARLVPEKPEAASRVNWTKSPALLRDRTKLRELTGAESSSIIHDAAGQW